MILFVGFTSWLLVNCGLWASKTETPHPHDENLRARGSHAFQKTSKFCCSAQPNQGYIKAK